MSILIKIAALAVSGALLSVMLKKHHREYAIVLSVAVAVVILLFLSGMLESAIESMKEIAAKSGVKIEYFSLLMKIIFVAYFSDYVAAVLIDAEESAIAKKVELAGKVVIFILTVPILQELFLLVTSII